MCQSHPGPEITQEYLNSLATLANYTLPTPAALWATALPNGWEPVPGEVPAPYQAELYTGISDAEGGEGTRRRSTTGENGRSRNLVFPPAPEPLPYPIVDNHTHMDLLDGEVEISARDALDAGEKLGIAAIVQVGCDIPSSLYAVAAAQADERVRILDEEGAPERTVFHCYSGGPELAAICNERGWYMSFAGTVTFKNSKGIQESLAMSRPELILAETDAPFLTPHPFRGRPNASYMTNYTVRFMAAHRGEELEALCRRIRENSERVYGQW